MLNTYNELFELSKIIETEEDVALFAEFKRSLTEFQKRVEKTYYSTLLHGKYDELNAIITIHSGAGGTESNDWVSMLYRMYTRFAERNDYIVTVLDGVSGDVAGLKNISFLISGDKAYGYLKGEKGTHRLIRVSPFDANGRRHTTFASVEVMPEVEDDTVIKILPEDIRIDTYRSTGAGGQNVNKTDSAVRITHLPTGIVVTCQNERSQIQNKEIAMKLLKSKLAEIKEKEFTEKLDELKGVEKSATWGTQIRTYTMHPYSMVKDHRTNYETSDVEGVLDGKLDELINEYLKKSNSNV